MKRKRKRNHNSAEMDRISDLPESIRNHIFSFLPMEDSVRTSILSKQWRNVCSSLSNLHFDPKKTDSKFNFVDSVNQLITCRDGSSVNSFNLAVDLDDEDDETVSYIRAWIDFALRYNVKELSFSVLSGKLSLPCSLFSSRMLVYLSLKNMGLDSPMGVVEFPMLKKLELEKIAWSDDEQTNQLIANCPLLETLVITECTWNVSELLHISNPNLRRLLLGSMSPTQDVKISCDGLWQFQHIGNPPNISLKILSFLVSAGFFFFPFSNRTTKITQKDVILRVVKMFMGLRNVRRLFLDNFSIQILSRAPDLLSSCKSSFCYLRDLNVMVFTTTVQLQFVASLVTICPNLYFLSITFKEHAQAAHTLNVEGCFQPQKLSELGTLEYICIRDISGSDNELYLIQHLLANAKILKRLSVACSKELSRDAQKQVIVDDKIQQFVKVSPLKQYCMSK